MKTVTFANITFRGLTRDILLTEGEDMKIIATVNADFIVKANRSDGFRQFLCQNYSTFDGQIPYLLARILCRGTQFEKIAGSDFIYDICLYANENHKKVFLLGGYANSNQKAVHILKKQFNIDIEGFSPKHMALPFEDTLDREIMSKISAFRPDFLLVGFGAPKQEYWIKDHAEQLKNLGVKWAMGVGGTFELVSGRIRRAPLVVQRLGLEGVFRLMVEPKFHRLKRLAMSALMFKYIWRPKQS